VATRHVVEKFAKVTFAPFAGLHRVAASGRSAGVHGLGWRYITFQVFKVDEVHARMIAAGARETSAPKTLGTTARISMMLDPDGNWIELSHRASIVGTLT
jgi:hypothetical protein